MSPRTRTLPLFRLYRVDPYLHLYTTDPAERVDRIRDGYLDEPCGCLLFANRDPDTLPLRRFDHKDPADHAYAVTEEQAAQLARLGYQDRGVLGFAYTARRKGTVPLYELRDRKQRARHFYTTDPGEAARVHKPDGFEPPRVLCHVMNDLLPSAKRQTGIALSIFGLFEGGLLALAILFGARDTNPLLRVEAAVPLMATVGAVVLIISAVSIGRERLAALGGRFDPIFRGGR